MKKILYKTKISWLYISGQSGIWKAKNVCTWNIYIRGGDGTDKQGHVKRKTENNSNFIYISKNSVFLILLYNNWLSWVCHHPFHEGECLAAWKACNRYNSPNAIVGWYETYVAPYIERAVLSGPTFEPYDSITYCLWECVQMTIFF